MNRIISKEEEREDPRRDSSIYLRVQIQWCFHIQSSNSYKNYKDLRIQCILQELQCFHTQSSNSAYRINSSTRNTTTTRLIPCRLLPATAPRVSKHSTRQNPAIRLLQHSKRSKHKQASGNSTRQKQHSTRQPASTQSLQQFPGQVLHYRILPGFIPKG